MFDGGDERGEAARVGLSVDEYREWRELNGTPLCGHVFPHGGVCRQVAGPAKLSPRAWLHLHRRTVPLTSSVNATSQPCYFPFALLLVAMTAMNSSRMRRASACASSDVNCRST
jgi:hypothetical protein